MYTTAVSLRAPRLRAVALAALAASLLTAASAAAQEPSDGHEHPAPPTPHEHHEPSQDEHAGHMMDPAGLFPSREASGTAWLPDATPMYGFHGRTGSWELMGHGQAFAQFLFESGDRGSRQGGSINWVMGMARRHLAGGRLGLRGMFSLEPWTVPGCGYPDLLATGEVCEGEPIHDRQHPHDLVMELSAEYDRPIAGAIRWHLYAGLAGEPALGPAAYPHRLSAIANPLAPISHHWIDATHITFGVVTGGLSGRRWRAEASLFNGREPDEVRWNLDLAPLDSFSGRVWILPTATLALQVSAGHLNEAEAPHAGDTARRDVDRVTASATYHRVLRPGSVWATTGAWGRNSEEGQDTSMWLIETGLTLDERDTWFARFEIGRKAAHDLGVHGHEVFTVSKLQGGYTRYWRGWHGLMPGAGGSISAGIVPRSLQPVYGRRVNPGLGVFVVLRPAPHGM